MSYIAAVRTCARRNGSCRDVSHPRSNAGRALCDRLAPNSSQSAQSPSWLCKSVMPPSLRAHVPRRARLPTVKSCRHRQPAFKGSRPRCSMAAAASSKPTPAASSDVAASSEAADIADVTVLRVHYTRPDGRCQVRATFEGHASGSSAFCNHERSSRARQAVSSNFPEAMTLSCAAPGRSAWYAHRARNALRCGGRQRSGKPWPTLAGLAAAHMGRRHCARNQLGCRHARHRVRRLALAVGMYPLLRAPWCLGGSGNATATQCRSTKQRIAHISYFSLLCDV